MHFLFDIFSPSPGSPQNPQQAGKTSQNRKGASCFWGTMMLSHNQPQSSVLASHAKADWIWGRLLYSSAESRAQRKPSVQVALIQREGCEGCPKAPPVALPNELLQCFPAAGGQRVMGQGGGPGAECVCEACKDRSQLGWLQVNPLMGMILRLITRPGFSSCSLPWTLQLPLNSLFLFPLTTPKGGEVSQYYQGPSLPNRMPARQGKDRRCYSPWTLNPLHLSLGKAVVFVNQISLVSIHSMFTLLTNVGVLSKVWVSIKKPYS